MKILKNFQEPSSKGQVPKKTELKRKKNNIKPYLSSKTCPFGAPTSAPYIFAKNSRPICKPDLVKPTRSLASTSLT